MNLRSSEEVALLMAAHGFESLPERTRQLRESATLPWLQSTVMVFRRLWPGGKGLLGC